MRHVFHLYDSAVMHRALIEALLVGAVCGAIGVHVLLRRLPFFTITVAHGSFPGVVLAVILGASVLGGALVFGGLIVLTVWLSGLDQRLGTSTSIGVALAGSFGVGAMLQSTQDGFSRELTTILVGQIVAVQRTDIVATAIIGILITLAAILLNKELVLTAFDRTEAQAQGRARVTDLAALVVVAAAVVTTVPAVGTILSVALLTIPAMTARLVTKRVESAMAVGAGFGVLAAVVGLTASAEWRVAAGAAITLSAAAVFLAVFAAMALLRRSRSAEQMIVLADVGRPLDAAG